MGEVDLGLLGSSVDPSPFPSLFPSPAGEPCLPGDADPTTVAFRVPESCWMKLLAANDPAFFPTPFRSKYSETTDRSFTVPLLIDAESAADSFLNLS